MGINRSSFGTVWRPASGFGIAVRDLRVTHAFKYPIAVRWLRRQLAGAQVIVSKPLFTSLGLTRLAGLRNDQFILDIDDWEVGLYRSSGSTGRLWDFIRPTSLNSFLSVDRLDRTIEHCLLRTVSNRWLADRYGGVIIPHVRDTQALARDPAARAATRKRLKMDGGFWVGYVGTIRKHKGVGDLIAAVGRLPPNVGLYLAGVDASDSMASDVVARARGELGEERLRVVHQFPFDELRLWLSAADVLCIPSRYEDGSVGQIPAKLFDAMAMGLPVVASAINDIPEILDHDAGLVVPPGEPVALAAAIERLLADRSLGERLGSSARARAEERYSYQAGGRELRRLLSALPVAIPARSSDASG